MVYPPPLTSDGAELSAASVGASLGMTTVNLRPRRRTQWLRTQFWGQKVTAPRLTSEMKCCVQDADNEKEMNTMRAGYVLSASHRLPDIRIPTEHRGRAGTHRRILAEGIGEVGETGWVGGRVSGEVASTQPGGAQPGGTQRGGAQPVRDARVAEVSAVLTARRYSAIRRSRGSDSDRA